ncbi:MAG TPA: HEAT repeat domain-containing protein [Myxococcota bacterium]|nr:HEAT repeat domain-containing protein [Myxococcota bacterium]
MLALAGQAAGASWTDWLFRSPFGPRWQAAAPMLSPGEELPAVEGADGRIYAFGKKPGQLRIYAPAENRWIEEQPPCVDRQGFELHKFSIAYEKGGGGYPIESEKRCNPGEGGVFPGPGGGVTDSSGRPVWVSFFGAYVYDAKARSWLALPHARYHLDVSAWEGSVPELHHRNGAFARGPDGRIYVIGGVADRYGSRHQRHELQVRRSQPGNSPDSGTRGRISARVETYDPASGIWSEIAPMRIPRVSPAAAFGADGKLYVFGGDFHPSSYNLAGHDVVSAVDKEEHDFDSRIFSWPGQPLADVEAFDPATGEWELRARMPRARRGARAMLGANGLIYLVGDCEVAWGPIEPSEGCVFVYDPAQDSWRTGPQFANPRDHVGAVATHDGRIYALGGSTLRSKLTLWSFWEHLSTESRGGVVPDVEFLEVGSAAPKPSADPPPYRLENRTVLERFLRRLGDGEELYGVTGVELRVTPRDADALAPLVEALDSGNWVVRRSALAALARMGSTAHPAEAAIVRRLGDERASVRRQAFETLLAIGGDVSPALNSLVADLRNPDFDVRYRATRAIGRVGAAAIPELEDELRAPDHPYRHECVEALREIGAPAAPALTRALAIEDRQVRISALFALAMLRTPASETVARVDTLLLQSDDRLLDWLAVFALSRLGPEGQPPLLRALRSPKLPIASAAPWALADSDPESPAVRQALEARYEELRGSRITAADELRDAVRSALAKIPGATVPPKHERPTASAPASSPSAPAAAD